LLTGFVAGFPTGLLGGALALAVVFLAAPVLVGAALTPAVFRVPLAGGARPARDLTGDATLGFTAELLLRTGRLADGIFWTLLKN